ncbi:hypothetical protein GCM10007082_31310 [Oceanisphaera arctica]|nr:hypothetical protein GCM10007082_31310 [Oceanisphaera arctica]
MILKKAELGAWDHCESGLCAVVGEGLGGQLARVMGMVSAPSVIGAFILPLPCPVRSGIRLPVHAVVGFAAK